MPGNQGVEEYVHTIYDGTARNYSYNYDKDMYTPLWVAYPLYSSTIGGTNTAGWKINPKISKDSQINVWDDSYNVHVGSFDSSDYIGTSKNYYARGHQVPDADRDNSATMHSQTYYATNSTPQIQNGFNSGIWSSLERGVRNAVPQGDTLYVVTGACFNKVGENRSVTYITPAKDTKSCPVPNYYWKVLLKVRRSEGQVVAASTIGFWLEHKSYSGESYSDYAVTVDQIEQWTGFNFFVNLSDALEVTAEKQNDWSVFCNF